MRARLAAVLLGFVVCAIGSTGIAGAHPLGNFTINHLARLSVNGNELHVRYVLDIAEIPTFQIMRASSPTGNWNQTQRDAWARSEVSVVTNGFHVSVDGAPVSLQLGRFSARNRPGAGGLPLLYWVGDFAAPLAAGAHAVTVDDQVYSDRRIGWKDIIAGNQTEPTHELLRYPSALIGSPRRIGGLSFKVNANGAIGSIVARADDQVDMTTGSSSIVRTNALSDMFSNSNRTPMFVLLTMLVAFGLGALHAIEPGHGKALLAFTLVGSRATVKQAAILAASLTFAHTVGVFILGAVLFFAAGFVSESIYPWITLISGIAIAIIGARNLARFLRARRASAAAAHDHDHGPGGHSHAVPGNSPLDFRAAIVAAMSGGIAPCPAAIVVMLAALRLHQMGYGLVLIVIFSLGLATVLTALGIAVVHGSALVTRSGKFDRIVAAGPLISAVLISIVGAVMVGQGVAAQGVHASAWTLAGVVAIAIAAYGLLPKSFPTTTAQAATQPTLTSRRVDSPMEQMP